MKRLFLYLAIPGAMVCLVVVAVSARLFPPHPKVVNHGDTVVPIKVQIEPGQFNDFSIIYIHDTAATTEAIGKVLGKDYGELARFMAKLSLKPGRFIAWYYSMSPPWSLDAAVEVDRVPDHLEGRILTRVQPGGAVLIAHVQGPYDQVGQAYTQIANWLRKNKRKSKGDPFEVYLNDPGSVKDPSELRTDIYQPLD